MIQVKKNGLSLKFHNFVIHIIKLLIMNSQTFLTYMFAACIALCFFACGQDPEPPTPPSTQEFSCKINGKPFTGAFFTSSLIFAKNQFSGDWSKRFDVQAENQARDTLVTLTFGLEPASDSVNACLPIAVDFIESTFGASSSFSTILVGNQIKGFPVSGVSRLSKCDASALMADGTFENVAEILSTTDTIRFTEGKFKNISFTLIQ